MGVIASIEDPKVNRRILEHKKEYLALRDRLPEELRGLVTFAYKSGWRYSEITDLEWSEVDRKQAIVRLEVGTTKNKKARVFYLDEELKEIFKTQFANCQLGCPYVFHCDG